MKISIIAVNDGSTDETPNILNRYASADSRIKVFSKQNGGYASAVNHALDYITGTYFLFMGSDDYLSTDLFQSIVQHIDPSPTLPDFIGFRTRKIIDGVLKGNDSYTSFSTTCFETNTTIRKFIDAHPKSAAIFSIRDTSKCFKTSMLGNLRYFGRYGIDADGIFSMMFAQKAHSFLSVPEDGYFWTLRTDSVSHLSNMSVEKTIDRINNWHHFYKEVTKLNPEDITPPERNYLAIPLHALVELSLTLHNAFRYRHYIKNELAFFLPIAKLHAPHLINKAMRLTKCSPPSFSFIYSLLRFMRGISGIKKT